MKSYLNYSGGLMVALTFKKRVTRENHDESKPLMVEVPQVIVDGFNLRDGDEIEWTYEINCKNQKKVTFTYKYTG